jgi:hypothetical protein
LTFSGLNGVISQERELFITNAERNSISAEDVCGM